MENPITIDERTWFYDEKDTISLVHELYKDGDYVETVNIELPQKIFEKLNKYSEEQKKEIIKYIEYLVVKKI